MADNDTQSPSLFNALPGGVKGSSVEVTAALIVLGALAFLIAVRKGFASVLGG